MRLTHLKLAGFKSFVDSTTIHLHGQRVGVVGPNGCGKSNVMESVRWVLGESSAKEMRADAMDAVIFNGSANRKPIARASVELIFDNSLGGASGEWNQYAEIAVKRVIEREKGSTYYINNTAVRRRDVADLFLGTGLGGRAYAIIGQNTISRIVEAKPEELRIFLEEAAGISKYKERRRETELRLRDTRENLLRVEDICRELQKQITKLESQALTTQQYHALQADLKLAEGQLWLLKKRDANRDWQKSQEQVEKLVNQLEAQTADLRQTESQLESSRQAFYAASEHINQTQAAYYEANAEVSHLENQLKQNTEARERMVLQLQQLSQQTERQQQAQTAAQATLTQHQQEAAQASADEAQALAHLNTLKEALPAQAQALKLAASQAQSGQQQLTEARQQAGIERNHVYYLNQSLQENKQRIARLSNDMSQLVLPDAAAFTAQETALQRAQQDIEALENTLQQLADEESSLQLQLAEQRALADTHQRVLTQTEAEITSLRKMQQSLNAESKLADWLSKAGLKDKARLWQSIEIDAAWAVALEALLGEWLNALVTDLSPPAERPPGTLALGFVGSSAPTAVAGNRALPSVKSAIKACPPALAVLLDDWLAHCYLLKTDQALDAALSQLKSGEKLVNAEGDIYSRHGVIYHGKNTHLHGVIERQQRLTQLQAQLPAQEQAFVTAKQALADTEQKIQQVRQSQQQQTQSQKTATQQLHQQQLALSRLQQQRTAAVARQQALHADMTAAQSKTAQLTAEMIEKEALLTAVAAQLSALEAAAQSAIQAQQLAEQAHNNARNALMQAEKTYQELSFKSKLINNKINELINKINVVNEEIKAASIKKTELDSALTLITMETLKANLSAAITQKHSKESALSSARNQLAAEEAQLQSLERDKLQREQQLHPMRDALEQARLKAQEARLYFEQCQAQLKENGLDEAVLVDSLREPAKTSTLIQKTQQLAQMIAALGAVNLAAIQELAHEVERKSYLDSQVLDLSQASQTLEQAIAKIDRETREKLMHTFTVANQHFAELFATLFGGGQARLELLGDEILDTGLQVFAQPPGKKNTTIQLLSGGEKALTALALVFALFRLNPAPFCLMDEVDAPLDDSNTERFCLMVKKMSEKTQFLFVSHNKITMEMAQQLIGVTMQESGVSRIVDVDIEAAMQLQA